MARDLTGGLLQGYLEFEIRRVGCPHCGVKREKLDWLADNPFYTKRFTYYVGRRCRDSTLKVIAEELDWDWKTVKDLDKQYLREQLRRVGWPTCSRSPSGSSGATSARAGRGASSRTGKPP